MNTATRCFVVVAAVAISWGAAHALTTQSTPRQVTATTGGQNVNASIDKGGKLIVFTSNVNHETATTENNCGVAAGETAPYRFDFKCEGNDFASLATPPEPSCLNCGDDQGSVGNLYLWRQKKKGKDLPANSIQQLTFSTAGGLTANSNPQLAQTGKFVVFESDQAHEGATEESCSNCSNADGNREIFIYEVKTGELTQITDTTGNGNTANRLPQIDDTGRNLVFDSRADFAAAPCDLLGGGLCDNADGNSEIIHFNRQSGRYTQITQTVGGGSNANIRADISGDGKWITFQSNQDLAGAGLLCEKLDGSACSNDGNAEIFVVSLKDAEVLQATDTPNAGTCSGSNPNERATVSNGGRFVAFQSKCEADLNPLACGDCNGNDEVFLLERKKGKIVQVTISDAGFNRVPRIAGSGAWMVFEANRDYKNLNPSHTRILYILKRDTKRGIVIEDALGPIQDSRAKLISINFSGGFGSSVETFGISKNGRFVAFDNSKGVGNQEIWFLDRNK